MALSLALTLQLAPHLANRQASGRKEPLQTRPADSWDSEPSDAAKHPKTTQER